MTTLIILAAEYLIFLIAGLAALWFLFSSNNTRRDIVLFAAFTLPLVFLVASVASMLYAHPQPFLVDGTTSLIEHAADNAFPSHHMLAAAAIASVVFLRQRLLGSALWILALVVGIARIAAELHYPVDILVSALIASLVPLLTFLVLRRLELL